MTTTTSRRFHLRRGPNAITIVDPNHADEGVAKVLQKSYDKVI